MEEIKNPNVFRLKKEVYDELAETWDRLTKVFAKYEGMIDDREATLMLIEYTCRFIELGWKGKDVEEVLDNIKDCYAQVRKEDWYKRLND